MNCRTFHRTLEDYLEGGLDFPQRFGMERHAQQCFACGQAVAEAQRLGRLAREMPRLKTPPDFEARLMARIRAEGLRRPRTRFWHLRTFLFDWPTLRPYAWGATALALVAAGLLATAWRLGRYDAPVSGPSADLRPPMAGAELAGAGAMPIPESVAGLVPVRALSEAPGADAAGENVLTPVFAEPGGDDFGEYLIPGPGERELRLRLPRTLRMHYVQPSEDYYIRNVSH